MFSLRVGQESAVSLLFAPEDVSKVKQSGLKATNVGG